MNMEKLNELRNRAYKTAREHGFHDEELSNEHLLCLVISELMEAIEADRKGKYFPIDEIEEYNNLQKDKFCIPVFKNYIKDTVEDELADVVIRLLDLAGLRDIDLSALQEPLFDKFNINPEFISWKFQLKEMSFTERIFFLCSIFSSGEGIEDIVRSAILTIFLNADILGIDLLWHIDQKMKYNELRPAMHGKKY
ncbi:hypothetical protein [uncultured Parabacteroides sp.]|uniref:hypothetical protein n=1 Tax=uncultured Parabacteroides sp. TaxID=512312 RepID=UPI002659059C|nr:hypothetical protein [uncultured Parabacteroides sp.]